MCARDHGPPRLHDGGHPSVHRSTRSPPAEHDGTPARPASRGCEGAAFEILEGASGARPAAVPGDPSSRGPRVPSDLLGRRVSICGSTDPSHEPGPARVLHHIPRDDERIVLRRQQSGALPRHEPHRQFQPAVSFAEYDGSEGNYRRRGLHLFVLRLDRERPDRVLGSDVPNNQPVTTKYLYYAKKQGTKVAVVNPMREPGLERYWVPSVPGSALFGTRFADEFFTIHTGGDIAFINGVLRHLIENRWIDEDFIEKHTTGFYPVRGGLVANLGGART